MYSKSSTFRDVLNQELALFPGLRPGMRLTKNQALSSRWSAVQLNQLYMIDAYKHQYMYVKL